MEFEPKFFERYGIQREADGLFRTPCGSSVYAKGTNGVRTCNASGCIEDRTRKATNILQNLTETERTILMANNDDELTPIQAAENRVALVQKDLGQAERKVKDLTYVLDLEKATLDDLRIREREEREAKAAWEQQRKEKARGVIFDQLQTLSPERVADLLAEAGLTQVGPRPQTARSVLQEAFDTLKASFWIKSSEYRQEGFVDAPWSKLAPAKSLLVKSFEDDTKYAIVTGVCSVGALGLAKAMLDDTSLQSFGPLYQSVREVRIATEALAWAVRLKGGSAHAAMTHNAMDCVVRWNDANTTKREEILAVWEYAFQCPFLDLPDDGELFTFGGGLVPKGLIAFTDRDEAEQALAAFKSGDYSFSPVIERVVKENKPYTPAENWEKNVNATYIDTLNLPAPNLVKV